MDERTMVWNVVQEINRICQSGKNFEQLGNLFHADVAALLPGQASALKGRETCMQMYRQACEPMTIHRLDALDEQIEIAGSTATVTFRYETEWSWRNKTHRQTGHETQVFSRTDEGWKLAWRTLAPESRTTESESMEAPASNVSNETLVQCLDLMHHTEICDLSTIDENGFPQITPMNNLRHQKLYRSMAHLFNGHDHDLLVYLSTRLDSQKVARLKANPKATICFCSPDLVRSVTLAGKLEIVTDMEIKRSAWQEGWHIYYPNGPEGAEYGLLKMQPTVLRGWGMPNAFEIKLQGDKS